MESQCARRLVINNPGMTRDEMLQAAEMRLDGCSWEKVGYVLNKDYKNVSHEFRAILSGEQECIPKRTFEKLREWMFENQCSSKQLAQAIYCSRSTINCLFEGNVSQDIVRLVAEYTGLDKGELMREYYDIRLRALERKRLRNQGRQV